MIESGAPLGTQAQFKLALMRAIDTDLKRRFPTLVEAAEFADVTWMRLSRLRSGRHEYFSVNWLFHLAEAAQVHIRISVDPVNR
jgi:hypothetical protein